MEDGQDERDKGKKERGKEGEKQRKCQGLGGVSVSERESYTVINEVLDWYYMFRVFALGILTTNNLTFIRYVNSRAGFQTRTCHWALSRFSFLHLLL